MKDSFIVYKEWNALIRTLDDAQRLAFYDLLFDFDGKMPDIKNDNHLKGVVNFVFLKVIDNDDKFQEKSQKSRESAYARWNKHRDKTDANALIALRHDATTDGAMLNEHVNGNENEPVNKNVKKGVKFDLFGQHFSDSDVNQAFIDFIKNRIELKKKPTQRAIELMVKRARETFKSKKEVIQAIENSIASGWSDIYPPKQNPIKPKDESYFSRAERGINLK